MSVEVRGGLGMCVVVVGGRGQGPAEGGGGGGQGRRSIPTLEEGDCGVSLSLGRAESLPAAIVFALAISLPAWSAPAMGDEPALRPGADLLLAGR